MDMDGNPCAQKSDPEVAFFEEFRDYLVSWMSAMSAASP